MLSCRTIAGIPTPSIRWSRRDRRPFSSRIVDDNAGAITFRDVTLEEEGDYECHAENVAGKVSASIALHVQQIPVITLEPNATEITLTEGDELKIECSAVGSPTPSVILKNAVQVAGFNLVSSPRQSTPYATIQKYNARTADEGTYICTATNDAGSDERYITVFVHKKRGDIGKQKERFPLIQYNQNKMF